MQKQMQQHIGCFRHLLTHKKYILQVYLYYIHYRLWFYHGFFNPGHLFCTTNLATHDTDSTRLVPCWCDVRWYNEETMAACIRVIWMRLTVLTAAIHDGSALLNSFFAETH